MDTQEWHGEEEPAYLVLLPRPLRPSWTPTLLQALAGPAVAVSEWGEVPRSHFSQHLESIIAM